MKVTGDQMLMFALDPKIRLSIGFAFNGRRASYDPICGSVNPDFELPESAYFLVYKLFPNEVKLDDILETERVTINDSKFIKSDDYGDQYDQKKVDTFNKKLNTQ